MEEQRGYTITETQVQVQARVNTSSCPRRMLAQPKHTRKWLSLHSDQGFQLFVFPGEGQQTFTNKHSSLSLQCKPVYWRSPEEAHRGAYSPNNSWRGHMSTEGRVWLLPNKLALSDPTGS